jgi:hypothetical protein
VARIVNNHVARGAALFFGKSVASAALTCLVTACGHTGSIAATSGNKAVQFPTPVARIIGSDDDAARGNIYIAHDVRAACALADDEAYFAFDLLYIRASHRRTFRALADCFESGPLRGREINLIGQVDLRGPRDRNELVARQRAANVWQIIVAESPHMNTIAITARESIDSTGASQSPWIEDGCVDVQCVDVVARRRHTRSTQFE